MVPIGIRPTNDYAFVLTFGTPENNVPLMSLLNAILSLPSPIADVQIENPYNYKEFLEDKMSILDIRASDGQGWIYHIEMQVAVAADLTQRLVYYACDQYADQLRSGDEYGGLNPVFTICLIEDKISDNAPKIHHAFRLTDMESGRTLKNTIEIHTLELGRYNLSESDLAESSQLERWLYWLLHAHEYDTESLKRLFPQAAFVQATGTIDRIARVSEDKNMYDLREKRRRDQRWIINSSIRHGLEQGLKQGLEQGLEQGRQQGLEEGQQLGLKNGLDLGILFGQIKSLQKLLGLEQIPLEDLMAKDPAELKALVSDLEKTASSFRND
jgi:predicted transposase/invertase (TIGR01784 family)